MRRVYVSGSFDDMRSRHVRLLQEAAASGAVQVLLWPDGLVSKWRGRPPRFPQAERRYLLEALRFVAGVTLLADDAGDPAEGRPETGLWVLGEDEEGARVRAACEKQGLPYRMLGASQLAGFPAPADEDSPSSRPRVVVTGCYDWLHSGHVRFFEQTSRLGELYVVVGSDANVRLLKGPGHPLYGEEERRYMVQAIRHVHVAAISSGRGWLDAEPEIGRIRPAIYVVNEDGDVPEKRAFCAERGIEYVVLERAPRPGLAPRQSSELRGF